MDLIRMFVGRIYMRYIHDACIIVASNKEDKLRNVQSLHCNRYRSGRAAEPPLDMRKLSPSMSTRLWNIVFPLSVTFYSLFFCSPQLFSRSPFSLAFWLAVNHSQFQCSIPVSSIRFVLLHPRSENEQKFVGEYRRRWISFTVNVPYLRVENHVNLRVYIDAANGYMSGLNGGLRRKERRFSTITGFELRLCPFKYFRDEYFLIDIW